jgi:DNA-3-methyladenine glycosylase
VELVARELLGAILVSRVGGEEIRARITETEAYLGREDPASHGYRGRLHEGNRSLYLPPGHWYVYRSYGIHWCANLVAAPNGLGAAVLLRAASLLTGEAIVRQRRPQVVPALWTNGPGKLCQALGIDRALDGVRMDARAPVVVIPGQPVEDRGVQVTPRIGITKAADWPLRFLVGEFSVKPGR